jgi:hypothetical protein
LDDDITKEAKELMSSNMAAMTSYVHYGWTYIFMYMFRFKLHFLARSFKTITFFLQNAYPCFISF